jgi:hypothetical protein
VLGLIALRAAGSPGACSVASARATRVGVPRSSCSTRCVATSKLCLGIWSSLRGAGSELGSGGAGFGRRRLIGVSCLIGGGAGSWKIIFLLDYCGQED